MSIHPHVMMMLFIIVCSSIAIIVATTTNDPAEEQYMKSLQLQYSTSNPPPNDQQQALNLMLQSARAGNPYAKFALVMRMVGQPSSQNIPREYSFDMLPELCNVRGVMDACEMLATVQETKNPSQSLHYAQKAANAGLLHARTLLCWEFHRTNNASLAQYCEGPFHFGASLNVVDELAKKNKEEAIQFFDKVSQSPSVTISDLIQRGIFKDFGLYNVVQNEEAKSRTVQHVKQILNEIPTKNSKPIPFMQKLHMLESQAACRDLAQQIQSRQLPKGLHNQVAKQMCQNGDAHSQYILSLALLNGKISGRKDTRGAMSLMKMASDKNHLDATWKLAEIYEGGWGRIAPNDKLASKYYDRANRISNNLPPRRHRRDEL